MKLLSTILILCSVLFIVACKKESGGGGTTGGGGNTPFTPNCNGAAIQFTANVAPIISSSCAVSSCHDATSSNGPGPLTTYAQINAAKVQIRAAIINGTMPKSGTISTAQKNSIICWIDAGAANN
jgi:hypothetical protein